MVRSAVNRLKTAIRGVGQKRALYKLPHFGKAATEYLKSASDIDLASIMRAEKSNDGWLEASKRIEMVMPIPDMTTGGVNPGDRRALYYLVRALGPRSVLEIGTCVGASTFAIAMAMNDAAPKDDKRLETVDIIDVNDLAKAPWKSGGLLRTPREAGKLLELEFVQFTTSDSEHLLSTTERSFDLIFLDGLHLATQVYKEVPLALKRLSPGGIVVLHDYFPNGVPLWPASAVNVGPWLAIERLKNEIAGITVLPLGALPWPTKLNSNVTSLAVVAKL
ncbi:class I SAM-dependent methyltransferase [Mesorhizobium sp. M0142]|uniref:O-methyltransferase n=1 Tax=Mesorhizobium sp. M0142 TaxID=2956894 RepID=UPI003336EA82